MRAACGSVGPDGWRCEIGGQHDGLHVAKVNGEFVAWEAADALGNKNERYKLEPVPGTARWRRRAGSPRPRNRHGQNRNRHQQEA